MTLYCSIHFVQALLEWVGAGSETVTRAHPSSLIARGFYGLTAGRGASSEKNGRTDGDGFRLHLGKLFLCLFQSEPKPPKDFVEVNVARTEGQLRFLHCIDFCNQLHRQARNTISRSLPRDRHSQGLSGSEVPYNAREADQILDLLHP